MTDKVEFTSKDLIDRPGGLTGTGGTGGGINIKQIQGWVKDLKGIFDSAAELGIDLKGFLKMPGVEKLKGKINETLDMNAPNAGANFAAFLTILEMRYGNITLNELVERLRADYGEKNIRDLRMK